MRYLVFIVVVVYAILWGFRLTGAGIIHYKRRKLCISWLPLSSPLCFRHLNCRSVRNAHARPPYCRLTPLTSAAGTWLLYVLKWIDIVQKKINTAAVFTFPPHHKPPCMIYNFWALKKIKDKRIYIRDSPRSSTYNCQSVCTGQSEHWIGLVYTAIHWSIQTIESKLLCLLERRPGPMMEDRTKYSQTSIKRSPSGLS